MLPENLFALARRKVRREWVICFCAALLLGLAAHLYRLTNWLPNWDGLVFRYDTSEMSRFGRCFLGLANGLSSWYELPWLNGLLSLLWLALAAVCICALFRVKKPLVCALIGGLTVVFPTVTSTMTYMYTADGYCLAMLCACLSALLLDRGGKGRAAGVLLLMFACGCYQAYVSVTIVLLLLRLADELIFGREPLAAVGKRALWHVLCGLLAAVGYWLCLQAALALAGGQLSDYQGINAAAGLLSADPVKSVKLCCVHFFRFFFDFSRGVDLYSLLNVLLFVLLAVFFLYALFRRKLFRPWPRGIAALLCLALLPFGAGVLYFISPDIDFHNLMTMGYIAFPLLLILLYERGDGLPPRILALKSWSILLVCAVMLFNDILIANISYHQLQMAYERSYGTAVRIADRIEQTDGAADCTTLAVFGALEGSEAYELDLAPGITGSTDGYLLRADDAVVEQSVLTTVLNDYCGADYRFAGPEEKADLAASGALEGLEPWPGRDCVAVSGDTVILILGDAANG